MPTIFVTGAQGMLGKAVCQRLIKDGHLMFTLSRKRLDITDHQQVHQTIKAANPDYVINCAAYTAVDKAESEPEKCLAINARAVAHLAETCRIIGAKLIHFSTDYVFNGSKQSAYLPTDATDPLNVYGRSKALSERHVQQSGCEHLILRTSWLYAPWGKNFLRFVKDSNKDSLNIVQTQRGNPTSVLSLANFLAHVIATGKWHDGVYHYADRGEVSWFAFAKAIKTAYALKKQIKPIDTFPSEAVRPENSCLDCALTEEDFDYQIPSLEQSIAAVRDYAPDF